MKHRWTDDELVSLLAGYIRRHGILPTGPEYMANRGDLPDESTVRARLGGWNTAWRRALRVALGGPQGELLQLLLAQPGVYSARSAAEYMGRPIRKTQRELVALERAGWKVHRVGSRITLTRPDRPDLIGPNAPDVQAQLRAERVELAHLRKQVVQVRETLRELDRRVQEHEFQKLALEQKKTPSR